MSSKIEITKQERDRFTGLFELAEDNEATNGELDKLEAWQDGITEQLFGVCDRDIILRKAKAIRKRVCDSLSMLLDSGEIGDLPRLYESLSIPATYIDGGSLFPVDLIHDDICSDVLRRVAPVDIYDAQKGWRLENSDGINFDPQNKRGSESLGDILPYFKSTHPANISLDAWARSPLLQPIGMYHFMRQDLVKGYNMDLISLFDERVSEHHIVHVPNVRHCINPRVWGDASAMVSGEGVKGVAIYDGACIWDLPYKEACCGEDGLSNARSAGWDVRRFTNDEAKRFQDRNGLGVISGFATIVNDIYISHADQNVRFFPNEYGYFIPILIGGSDKIVTLRDMKRSDDLNGDNNLWIKIQMLQACAIRITGSDNSAKIQSDLEGRSG